MDIENLKSKDGIALSNELQDMALGDLLELASDWMDKANDALWNGAADAPPPETVGRHLIGQLLERADEIRSKP